jgi:hypothetical protein
MALVGAVNIICYPEVTIGFSKLGVLSPDGHCKVSFFFIPFFFFQRHLMNQQTGMLEAKELV